MNNENTITQEHHECSSCNGENNVTIRITGQNIMYICQDERFIEENTSNANEKIVLADKSQTLDVSVTKNFVVKSRDSMNTFFVTNFHDSVPKNSTDTQNLIVTIPTGTLVKTSSNQNKHTTVVDIEAEIDCNSDIILLQGTKLFVLDKNNSQETRIKMTLDETAKFTFERY